MLDTSSLLRADLICLSAPKGLPEESEVLKRLIQEFACLGGLQSESAMLQPLPPGKVKDFRLTVAEQAPRVCAFAQTVRMRLLQGALAIQVSDLGLRDLTPDLQGYCLFALGCLLGVPTATDPREKRVLWDVKPRVTPLDHFATFSETDEEARFHTDTQYYANPERYFFLYARRAARCGGGLNSFASGLRLINELVRRPGGIRTFNLLSQIDVPFRVPSAFSLGNAPEYQWSPIISSTPLLRFREDTLFDGEKHFPELPWAHLREAVAEFVDAAEAVATERVLLPDDSIIFVNNHEGLHARTAFTDLDRHLIRVRIHA